MPASIIACGLTRAARPRVRTLRPKNPATTPTAIAAPIAPLWPPTAALITTMTAATAAVTVADRRAIGAMFASIFWKTPDDLFARLGYPADREVVRGASAVMTLGLLARSGQVSRTYHGPRTTLLVGARERYHKLSGLVFQEVT